MPRGLIIPLPGLERQAYTPFVKAQVLAFAGPVTEGLETAYALGYEPVRKTCETFREIRSILTGPEHDGCLLTHASDTTIHTKQHVPTSTTPGADPTVSHNLA